MRVQLSLRAEGLANCAGFGHGISDPYARIVYSGGYHAQEGNEIGQTEVIKDSLTCEWIQKFIIEYDPGVYTPIEVTVFDSNKNREDAIMGRSSFEISEVLASPGHTQSEKMKSGGTIFIHIEESIKGPHVNEEFHFQARGLDIKNVEAGVFGLGRSDPFYELAKKEVDVTHGIVHWNVVYRSEYLNDALNPSWAKAVIGLEELCYCDLDWPLRLTVMDWQKKGKHRPIGSLETTVSGLMNSVAVKGNADREKAIEIHSEQNGGHRKSQGLVVVLDAHLAKKNMP